jgi:hypothetical protein
MSYQHWGRPVGQSGDGGDPGAGEAVAIPTGARSFSVLTVGTGRVLVRVQESATPGTVSAATAHAYPAGQLLGPFGISEQWDKHVIIAEDTGAAITAYFVNFYRP